MPHKEGNVLSWAPDIDGNTMAQAQRSASLPFIEGHVALMPDAHFGYGATVGSVIPTLGAIIPSAVGVDIGCGMIAARLNLTAAQLPDDLGTLHGRIAKSVPSGVGKGHELGSGPAGIPNHFPALPITQYNWGSGWQQTAYSQFGSLGSGNHFVEVCLDEHDSVWVVLHSGSRGIGNKVANMHIDKAKGVMKSLFITLPDPDLAYITEVQPDGSTNPDFAAYITDMLWAQDYALGNREAMMDAVLRDLATELGFQPQELGRINCHHNFTQKEHHNGKNLWITRKGAIRARSSDMGIIPGSMGARSYVVSGLNNASAYCSCSHGAGRKMSRAAAKRDLDEATLVKQMEGIAWNGNTKALIDEDPRAYKDIDEVMANQSDLVKIEYTLHQVLNYKGA